jgi:hypothetical protein
MPHAAIHIDVDPVSASNALEDRRLLQRLRRCLPLGAHPSERLRKTIVSSMHGISQTCRCKVINVFDVGARGGIMCQFEVGDSERLLMVAPITEISFGRRHPLSRDIADYRRRSERERTLNLRRGVKE